MTIWRPDPSKISRPAYLSLAEQIARAIEDGQLADGTRLPPHRQMADDLEMSVQTVSRAYEELIRRGLIAGHTGRGTFVRLQRREPDPPYLPERLGDIIDLSILKPVCEAMHVERLKGALARLADALPPSAALSFRPNMVFPRHRLAAVEWLRLCGLEVAPANVRVTNGATAGMTVALMSAAGPGSIVATEAIGHHTLVPLASYLGFKLKGLRVDDQGIVPEALDEACRELAVRALFIQPSVVNPTAGLMGAERRAAIAQLARRHEIAIIENDVLGPLVAERAPPLASFAPERSLYVTSFSKIAVPGLRIGYLVAPDRYVAAVANRHLVTNWMATPLVAEIATQWIADGTALDLVDWQRRALHKRHKLAAELFGDLAYRAHRESLHIWLPLAHKWEEEDFVAHARLQGVAIAPGASFRISGEGQHPAVRISVGSTDEAEFRRGLGIIANLLAADPEPLLLAI